MIRIVRMMLVFLFLSTLFAQAGDARAQEATPGAGSPTFQDPAGLYSVPVPTNWSVDSTGNVAVLRSPDNEMTVYLLVVEANDVTSGAKLAVGLIGPKHQLGDLPDSNQTTPSADGVDETAVITFVTEGGASFLQFYGQRIGEQVYFVIFEGTVEAATKRDSQIQQIASGFTISSLARVDLSDQEAGELTPAVIAEFEAYVTSLMARLQVPGASIAIVVGDQIVYAHGFGVKEIGGTDPVTADTRMMIGSTTKSMTTMMMATEVDDGLMSWDEPVVDILPWFAVADPALTKTLTMRNLVCACTGVPRRDLEFLLNASDLTAEDVIRSLETFQFYTGFGEAFQYSNQMVATGGYAAAAAATGSEDDLLSEYISEMQSRIFDPIGMNRTTLSFDAVEADANHATPHGTNLASEHIPLPLSYEEMLTPVAPAGLVWSTANDMGRYLITEIGQGIGPGGNQVVSSKNLQETWVPQVAVDGETSYGLGWFVGQYKGVKLIDHGGNTFGFTSDLAFLPDQGIGIATLTNVQGSNIFNEAVRTYLFELLYGLPHEVDAQIDFYLGEYQKSFDAVMAQIEDVPSEIARSAAGSYHSEVLGDLTLTVTDGVLIMDTGEFTSRLVMQKGTDTDRSAVLVAADAPFPGTPFTLSVDDFGVRTLVLVSGTDTYTFVSTDGGATPEAATPVS